MQKRFRQTKTGKAADIWVEIGPFCHRIELYENGEFVGRRRGIRRRSEQVDVHMVGRDFAALVRITPDGSVRCTWSR